MGLDSREVGGRGVRLESRAALNLGKNQGQGQMAVVRAAAVGTAAAAAAAELSRGTVAKESDQSLSRD